jgi:hypothetical protein
LVELSYIATEPSTAYTNTQRKMRGCHTSPRRPRLPEANLELSLGQYVFLIEPRVIFVRGETIVQSVDAYKRRADRPVIPQRPLILGEEIESRDSVSLREVAFTQDTRKVVNTLPVSTFEVPCLSDGIKF